MKTARIFIQAPNDAPKKIGGQVELNKPERHHLIDVLRCRDGDTVEFLCQESQQIAVGKLTGNTVTITKVEDSPPSHPVTLLIGLTESNVCDFVIEKCVELGVKSVIFFTAERSQRLGKEDFEKRRDRFNRIIEAAAKQCRTATVPSLQAEDSLTQAILGLDPSVRDQGRFVCMPPNVETPPEISLFCALAKLDRNSSSARANPSEFKGNAGAKNSPAPETDHTKKQALEPDAQGADFILIIGPEGGLTSAERKVAQQAGFSEVSLGERTLRSETAALIACGLVCAAV